MARRVEGELSHWDLCQFSFNYSTWGLNPHYHNKLYFYQQVQMEAAFQGIRLDFISVFLWNTVLPQLAHSSTQLFCTENTLLTQYRFSGGTVNCYSKTEQVNSICLLFWKGSLQRLLCCQLIQSVFTHHAGFHQNLPKGTCQRFLYQIMRKTNMEI